MRHTGLRALFLLAAPLWLVGAEFALTPAVNATLDEIAADSLKGHVSFLASDVLQGRDTPSPGLEIAGEYIASQFRAAGLEPGGKDGYFEPARFITMKPDYSGMRLVFDIGGQTFQPTPDNVSIGRTLSGLDIANAPLVKAKMGEPLGEVAGKVVITELPDFGSYPAEERAKLMASMREFSRDAARAKPAAIILLVRREPPRNLNPRLVDPGDPSLAGPTTLQVYDPGLRKAWETMQGGTASLKLAPPVQEPVMLRNVIGILRGSDPVLKNTYVIVSAHYDHVGVRSSGEDKVFNGANDNASGTAAMIEIARAFSKMRVKPKRSLAFIAYFGEEKGLFGSRYYGRNPSLPLDQTVANINLEQLGRTDDNDGPEVAGATLTGFDYSDVGPIFAEAGKLTGVRVYKNEKKSDAFFARSDNQALADVGVPAHTFLVVYEFPDYHRPGDEWQKLDYANMAKVVRTAALGVLMIADNPEPPKWNEANPKAAPYLKAWKEREGN
ncbi:MAG: M28 family peptidase [Rhodospirillales bacterium]